MAQDVQPKAVHPGAQPQADPVGPPAETAEKPPAETIEEFPGESPGESVEQPDESADSERDEKTTRLVHIVLGLVIAGLGAWQLDRSRTELAFHGPNNEPGPGYLPVLLTICLIGLGLALAAVWAFGPKARNGEAPVAGTVLIAGTDDHMELGPDCRLRYTPLPRTAPYRPSADVLFGSQALHAPRLGVAVVLTGMGTDGAEGLLRLRSDGWHTIVQNEATCVVFGMPRAAIEKRAAAEVLPLQQIGPTVVARLLGPKR